MGAREHFIESIDYLRKLGFFEEYSNLTSEEIFEGIRKDSILLKNVEKEEEEWARESDFEIDTLLAIKDKRRICWAFCYDDVPSPGLGIEYLNRLANISRGVFQPTDVREEYKIEEDESTLLDVGYCRVYFTYEGKERMLEFPWSRTHSWFFDDAMNELNRMIEHTGYSYHEILSLDDMPLFVVLKPEEAEKLRKERGWKLSGIW